MGGEDLLCSVPNRDVLVIGVGSIENDPTTGLVAADLHGNCDRCGYEGCTIYNGGAIGGRHPIYHLSRLIAASNGALLMLDEFRGGVVDLRNIQMRFDGTNVTFGDGLIDIGNHQAYFNEDTIETVHVLLDDYVLEAPNLAHDEALVRMANNGSDVAFNIRILRGKHITAGHRLRVLVSEVVSGTAASDGIIIDDISPALPSGSFSHLASGSAYASFPHHLPKQNITIDAATTAAEVIIPSAVTFPIGYPRAPHVVLGAPSSQNGSAFNSSLGTASGAAAVPFIYSVSSTDVRAGIRSGDGTAFANAQTFRLSLSVELREV
jgi:hypothetical protein